MAYILTALFLTKLADRSELVIVYELMTKLARRLRRTTLITWQWWVVDAESLDW